MFSRGARGRQAGSTQDRSVFASPFRENAEDGELLSRLRAGDELAFVTLVGRHQQPMVRLARCFVPSTAVAEEVVQETWLAMLRGLSGFEGRASFKTWLYRILVNRARTAGAKERRAVPAEDPERAVDPARFDGGGHWLSPPTPWVEEANDRLHAVQLAPRILSALDALPDMQRDVITLRDIEGLSSTETCDVLDITEANQRVLLHRGRSRIRQALETEFGGVSL